MARILKDFVFTKPHDTRRIFHWAEWADGKIRELTAGEDFPRKYRPEDVQVRAHNYARTSGIKVRTQKINNQKIVVQFYKPAAKRATKAVAKRTVKR